MILSMILFSFHLSSSFRLYFPPSRLAAIAWHWRLPQSANVRVVRVGFRHFFVRSFPPLKRHKSEPDSDLRCLTYYIPSTQVPEVCVNGNYPPELLDASGNVDFPDFLPALSDFILQASSQYTRHSSRGDIHNKHSS